MILILGYGLIGKSLYEALKLQGRKVLVLSRSVPQNNPDFISADINAIKSYEHIFSNIETVVHCLHTTVPATSNDDEIYDIQSNVIPFVSILNLCRLSGVKNFIFISSGGAVYGSQSNNISVLESDPTNPISSYGITKLACEKYLQLHKDYFSGNVFIIRPSNIYGKNQRTNKPNGIIGHVINASKNNISLKIWGTGNGVKDYLYVEDFIEALLLFINSKKKYYSIYNLSSGEHLTINQIVKKIEIKFGKEIVKEFLPAKSFDVESILLNSAQFNRDFNWVPKYNLEQFLNECH